MAAKKGAHPFLFVLVLLASSRAFASIPRNNTILDAPIVDRYALQVERQQVDDRESNDNARLLHVALDRAFAPQAPIASLAETRVRAIDVLAPFERQETSELSRALHQACALPSTTSASEWTFAAGDPVNHRDPTGLYEADVHYGLTRWLAQQAEFESIDAEIIANEDVGVDLHDETSPTANAGRGTWGAVYEYHFPISPKTRRVEEGVTPDANPMAWGKVNNARDLVDLGQGLHLLQDSFSHAGASHGNLKRKLGKTISAAGWAAHRLRNEDEGITHDFSEANAKKYGPEGGIHSVDWTFIDPEKLVRAAHSSYEAMIEYRLKTSEIEAGEANRLRMKWVSMEPSIRLFAKANTIEKKKEWFNQNLSDAVEKLPWDDLSLGLAKGK